MNPRSFSRFAQAVLRRHGKRWIRAARRGRRSVEAETIHTLRVSGRRLRAALKLFQEVLPSSAQRLRRELNDFGQTLGSTRDLDVHADNVSEIARAWPGEQSGALTPYRNWIETQRRQCHQRLQRRLVSPRLLRLRRDIERIGAGPAGADDLRMRPAAKSLLKKTYRRLRKASQLLPSSQSDRAIHQLRRAIRRLRYACEFLEPVGKRPLRKLTRQLTSWQNLLGQRQDRVLGLGFVRVYRARPVAKSRPPRERQALRHLTACLREEKKALQKAFFRKWRKRDLNRLKKRIKKAI
jgi:CHAD domain-containing protein